MTESERRDVEKLPTKSRLLHELATAIKEEESAITAHEIIAQVLKEKFAGKKITKRLATLAEPEIRKVFGDSTTVYYRREYGMCSIVVWGGLAPKYEARWDFYVGPDRVLDVYDPATFEDSDTCHGNAAKRRNEYRRILQKSEIVGQLAERIDIIQKAAKEIDALTDYGTPGEVIRYTVETLQKKP